MRFRLVYLSIALAVLATVAWFHRDSDALQGLFSSAPQTSAARLFERTFRPAEAGDSGPTIEGVRKCIVNSKPVYTDGTCPAGSQERPITGGAVTVIKAPVMPRPAGTPAPAARVDDAGLKERLVDKAVNQ
jgi:hypothetical protein